MDSGVERFGENVRRARQDRGWTQADLSAESGLAVVQISRIERGKREIRLTTFIRLLDALDISPETLLKGLRVQSKSSDAEGDALHPALPIQPMPPEARERLEQALQEVVEHRQAASTRRSSAAMRSTRGAKLGHRQLVGVLWLQGALSAGVVQSTQAEEDREGVLNHLGVGLAGVEVVLACPPD
jgi:transcriptional regulator with XRE-family HTH domain